MNIKVPGVLTPFEIDPDGICEQAALRACVDQSRTWVGSVQEKAAALLREMFRHRTGQLDVLLRGASRAMFMAVAAEWCGVAGDGPVIYPELRWCDFESGVVCFRAGLSAPLRTKQFEIHREQFEEIWGGPVSFETGASLQAGVPPGAVVVRPASQVLAIGSTVPAPPRMPLQLPDRIPLQVPYPSILPSGRGRR
jgi:hypothetical protein